MMGAPETLQRLVGWGLCAFAASCFEELPQPIALLLSETNAAEPELATQPWASHRDTMLGRLDRTEGPFRRLASALSLEPSDIFLLGLLGSCEGSHLVELALACLQGAEAGPRPTLHLALALRARLFNRRDEDALTLAGGRLVASGAVALEGEGPLPRRGLLVRAELWRALRIGEAAWPGCRVRPPEPPDADCARLAALLGSGAAGGFVLRGPPGSGRGALAAAIAAALRLVPLYTPPATYRTDAAFGLACRVCGWLPVVPLSVGAGEAERLEGPDRLPVIALAGEHGAVEGDQFVDVPLEPPDTAARARLWAGAVGNPTLAEELARSAVLYAPAIRRVGRAAATLAGRGAVEARHVAEARRRLAPEPLRMLSHPVLRDVDRDALILPEHLERELGLLIARCRQRDTVWDGAGPSLTAGRTRGVRALFAGESGTGKTLAASYLATRLGAPLFRCDLGSVMNKYIGESEKNLGRLLDHAAAADVVLLFDEADALFGRRSDGAETGERYANMLTNFLLTRIENHGGIVILTANNKTRIDPAFWRRLDAVLDFAPPGFSERLRLWKSHLGGRAPDEAVLHHLASYCDLTGGAIRNAVLSAAATVLPGAEIGAVPLAAALAREYRKVGRRLPSELVTLPAHALARGETRRI